MRPTDWETLLGYQELTREDLLAGFLAKQRRVAKVLGSEVPESPEALDAALAGAEGATGAADGPRQPGEDS